jgi:acyl phosphate:glycerol-3-phosphate acyltransferase
VTVTMILATAYLLGSIPASYAVAFIWTGGRDIHHIGDGNPGVMNVWDNIGFAPALIAAAGDIGKGTAAVGLAYWVSDSHMLAISAGLASVVGHDYSVFLRFKGGNGTATTIGAWLALAPLATTVALALTGVLFLVTRRKRFAGFVGLSAVPFLSVAMGYPPELTLGIVVLLAVLVAKIVSFEWLTPARSRVKR